MSKEPRRQFCERTLKFYFKEDTGERNFSQHEEHLQNLIEKENQEGTKREREPMEIRYMKLMFKKKKITKGKGKNKKTVMVDNPPDYLQQVIKEFPILLSNVHLNPDEDKSLEDKTIDAIYVVHEEVIYLLETNGKKDVASELIKRFNELTWKTFKTTVRGTKTKEKKIADFLNDFDF